MSFQNAVKKVICDNYANFKGRAGRKEFWFFFILNLAVTVVMTGLSNITGIKLLGYLLTIYDLAVLLPTLGVSIRRFHDIGKSGKWILVGLIPVVGAIIMLVMLFGNSEAGENQYGPVPEE